MEHVAFIVDATGERLRCMLNPESVTQRRRAGLSARTSIGLAANREALIDNVLVNAGGGMSVLELDLLFDVDLAAGSTIVSNDVRAMTAPIWALAEASGAAGMIGRGVPTVRFVWGKSWNIRGVISAVAERLEMFGPSGIPRRSWLRLRLVRVSDNTPERSPATPGTAAAVGPLRSQARAPRAALVHRMTHEVTGSIEADGTRTAERLDAIAFRYYGAAGYWRALALRNGLDSPIGLKIGMRLEIPPLSELGAK